MTMSPQVITINKRQKAGRTNFVNLHLKEKAEIYFDESAFPVLNWI